MISKRSILIVLFLFVGVLIFSACSSQAAKTEEPLASSEHDENAGSSGDEHSEEAPTDGGSVEEGDHDHVEVPDEFASLTNPLAGDLQAIAAGQTIYDASCAACHGTEGMGDGPASAALDPKPADLADTDMMSASTDGYLFWRVSKGGAFDPFNSAMPAFDNTLSETELWQVISYIRTLSQ